MVGLVEGDGDGAVDTVGCAVGGKVGGCVGSFVRVGVVDGDGDGIEVGLADTVGTPVGSDVGIAVKSTSLVGAAVEVMLDVPGGKVGIEVGVDGTLPGDPVGACPRTTFEDMNSSKHTLHRFEDFAVSQRRLIFVITLEASSDLFCLIILVIMLAPIYSSSRFLNPPPVVYL